MKKTSIWLLLVLVAVSLCFYGVACKAQTAETTVAGETAAATTAAATTAAATTAAATTAGEPVEVTFWNHPVAGNQEWEAQWWTETIAAFEKEYPNIKIKMDWVPWDLFWTKITAAVEGGNPPDLHHAGDFHTLAFVPDDKVVALDDIFAELGGDEAFSPLISSYKSEGHIWGLPYLEGGYLFYYNKEMFAEAGYDHPPKDWAEMIEIGNAINKPEEERYAIGVDYSAGNGTQQVFLNFRLAAGGFVMDEEGKIIWGSPETLEALTYYTDLWNKYKLVPPGLTAITTYETTSTPILTMFGNEQIGMMAYWQLGADQLATQFPETWAKTGVATFPVGPSGKSGSFAAANTINIFKDGGHTEEAKTFVRYFFRPEVYGAWIEGSGWIPGLNSAWDSQPDTEWRRVAKEQLKTMSRGFSQFGGHSKNGAGWEAFVEAAVIQDIIVNGATPAEAMAKGQLKYEEIYNTQ